MVRSSPQTERLVEVVEYLAASPQQSRTLTDIARQLDADKATCYPMLSELTRVGWLVKDRHSKSYRLGPRLVAIGDAAAAAQQISEAAHPALVALGADLRCMVCLVVPSWTDLIIADVLCAPVPAEDVLPLLAGDRLEFQPPLGSVLIAWSSLYAVDMWLRRDPTYAADPARCWGTLRVIRDRGFAVELLPLPIAELRLMTRDTMRNVYGSRRAQRLAGNQGRALSAGLLLGNIDDSSIYEPLGISAACFDPSGTAVAAVSAIVASTSMSGAAVAATGDRVRAAADAVTARLGGQSD